MRSIHTSSTFFHYFFGRVNSISVTRNFPATFWAASKLNVILLNRRSTQFAKSWRMQIDRRKQNQLGMKPEIGEIRKRKILLLRLLFIVSHGGTHRDKTLS